jgi:hypothetical protein
VDSLVGGYMLLEGPIIIIVVLEIVEARLVKYSNK